MEIFKQTPIKFKVFSRKDIKDLANLFYKEKKNEYTRIQFILVENDGSRYSFNDLSFIDNESKLDSSKIVEIRFRLTLDNRSMSLNLSHGDSIINEFQIEGNDEDWINAKRKAFEDILKDIKNQKSENDLYKFILSPLSFLCIWISILLFLRLINFYFLDISLSELNTYIYISVTIFISLLINDRSWRKLLNSYPKVEFDFGPEHYKLEKSKRKNLIFIIGTYVFPVILALISFLF